MAKEKKNNEQKTVGKEIKNLIYRVPENVRYIIGWIVFLVALFLILSYLFPIIFKLAGVGTVNYGGLTFTKELVGQPPNQITVYHYYYLYKDNKGELVQNNIYLRNNPSKMNVPADGNIIFIENQTVYVAIDTDNLVKCNQSSLAIGELSSFIRNAGHNVSAGTLNRTEAGEKNISYIDCGVKNDGMTVKVALGNSSQINSDAKTGCYQIYASSCAELLPATEKFIVQSIVDAKNRTIASLQ